MAERRSRRTTQELVQEPLENKQFQLEITKLRNENARLKGTIEKRLTALEQAVEELTASEQVVVLRTISREEAKDEIKELFADGGALYYSDIARQLQLDLPLVVELCHELEEEGEVYHSCSTGL